MEINNKARYLYLMLFVNADDKGFVGNAAKIVKSLDENENETLDLIKYKFDDALYDLVQRGLLYEFVNNHNDKVYLIRHWYYHNKQLKGMETNYTSLLDLVELVDNEYELVEREERGTKKGKEGKGNERKKEINNNFSLNTNSFSSCENSDEEQHLDRAELLKALMEDDDEDNVKEI